jgi:hypothetical protein
MAMNFIGCDRDQVFLMPPSLREWVPEDHLVWTVLDAVAEMDLGAFYASYRADGHGRPAYEPSMMVALLLYAYARGNRSSRGVERACVEDVAYRVVAGNLVPSTNPRLGRNPSPIKTATGACSPSSARPGSEHWWVGFNLCPESRTPSPGVSAGSRPSDSLRVAAEKPTLSSGFVARPSGFEPETFGS